MAHSEEWRREHLRTIGGSNAAVAIGKPRFPRSWNTRDLYDTMHAVIHGGNIPPPLQETDDMHAGTVFEPVAISELAKFADCEVRPHDQDEFVYHADLPWAHALPDGWLVGDFAPRPVEIKVPRPSTIAKCAREGIVEAWELQVQHTLMICGADVGVLALLDRMSGRLSVYEIELDRPRATELMFGEREFYDRILRSEPPEVEELPAEDDPTADGTPLVLDTPDAVEVATQYARLRIIRDDAEEALEQAKADLLNLAGGAQLFEVPNVLRVRHKMNKPRRLFQRAKAEAEFPALAEDRFWKLSKPSRPFVARILWDRGDE